MLRVCFAIQIRILAIPSTSRGYFRYLEKVTSRRCLLGGKWLCQTSVGAAPSESVGCHVSVQLVNTRKSPRAPSLEPLSTCAIRISFHRSLGTLIIFLRYFPLPPSLFPISSASLSKLLYFCNANSDSFLENLLFTDAFVTNQRAEILCLLYASI